MELITHRNHTSVYRESVLREAVTLCLLTSLVLVEWKGHALADIPSTSILHVIHIISFAR